MAMEIKALEMTAVGQRQLFNIAPGWSHVQVTVNVKTVQHTHAHAKWDGQELIVLRGWNV